MNRIQSVDTVMLRRLNPNLQIQSSARRIDAVLYVSNETEQRGIVEREVLKTLQVLPTNIGFEMTVITKTVWKKRHWRKWRGRETTFKASAKTFYRLLQAIKSANILH